MLDATQNQDEEMSAAFAPKQCTCSDLTEWLRETAITIAAMTALAVLTELLYDV